MINYDDNAKILICFSVTVLISVVLAGGQEWFLRIKQKLLISGRAQ
jgi:hypothetical protein